MTADTMLAPPRRAGLDAHPLGAEAGAGGGPPPVADAGLDKVLVRRFYRGPGMVPVTLRCVPRWE